MTLLVGNFARDRDLSCDFHADHDPVTGRPGGRRCGAAASARVLWLDGSGRYSNACATHAKSIDRDVPHRLESICLDATIMTRAHRDWEDGLNGQEG